MTRDRDALGRPRNARPRDELGRPLPRGAAGIAGLPDDIAPAPEQALVEAQALLDAGRPFHAHELLEAVWKVAPASERDLWQGLAQLAVGLTHAARGNRTGAQSLLRRGIERLAPYSPAAPYDVDVDGLRRWADQAVAVLSAPSGDVPVPRLRTSADVDRLTRWENFGGTWQVIARTADGVTLALCRCDGGEEVDRWTTDDPDVLALVGDRTSSD